MPINKILDYIFGNVYIKVDDGIFIENRLSAAGQNF